MFQLDQQSQIEETIAYASRSLKPAEAKYTTTEIEGLGVIFDLDKWYFIGRKIKIRTNTIALTFLSTCKLTNNRITRWIIKSMEFDIEWEHIKGSCNEPADTLSRLYQPKQRSLRPGVLVGDINEICNKKKLERIAT